MLKYDRKRHLMGYCYTVALCMETHARDGIPYTRLQYYLSYIPMGGLLARLRRPS